MKFTRLISSVFLAVTCLLLFTGCSSNKVILSQLDEKDANMIVVFLESKGIVAEKIQASSGGGIGGDSSAPKFNISVNESQTIDAMALLNQNGLPKKQGTNLLTLFAKQGLMSSDKEETIRYQAGLAQQISNTILMIDGVIDASVNLSFPPTSTTGEPSTERVTAAVYVKHQGVVDQPNLFLENKIKRLVSGSVNGLDVADVTVVSDRSRFTDVTVATAPDSSYSSDNREYVSIWSIVMSKQSAARFRTIFFLVLTFAGIISLMIIWLLWKFYPLIQEHKLLSKLFDFKPFTTKGSSEETEEPFQE